MPVLSIAQKWMTKCSGGNENLGNDSMSGCLALPLLKKSLIVFTIWSYMTDN